MMIRNAQRKWFVAIVVMALPAAAAQAAINIDVVLVFDDDNGPDDTGYGAVDYGYSIGRTEVTNTQYTAFLNAVAATDDHGLYNPKMGSSGFGGITRTGPSGAYSYSVISGRANMPVNYVSFWDACRFANWLHNGQGTGDTEDGAYTLTADGIANNTVTRNLGWQWAVTSEEEWYKAAYYDSDSDVYYDYPTGSDTAPTGEGPPGTDLANGSANYDWAVGDLTDVGAYTAKPSDSPYGTFDQGGNVWEWNETAIGSSRGLRGGWLCNDDSYLHASWRYSFSPTHEGYAIGFRVASVIPEPGSLLVWSGLAVMGLIWWRRRKYHPLSFFPFTLYPFAARAQRGRAS